MPRRKQHCPKRMEPGEDGEGGGSLAVKENSPVNEDDAEQDAHLVLAARREPLLAVKKEPESDAPSHLKLPVKIKSEKTAIKAGEADMGDDDEEDAPLRMIEEETGASPLDFSVKPVTCAKRKSRAPSVDAPKEKKIKAESTSFPLDLSVKRGSMSPSIASAAKLHHPHQHPAHARQQQPLNSVAKFSSRSESRNPSSSSSPPSASSSFSVSPSLNPRMTVNGSEKKKTFPGSIASRSVSSHGRQNPWQTQWISRSSEQTRDVFTCVWCKESFRSLQEMTMHMKESPRCGMAGMQHAAATSLSSSQQHPASASATSSTSPLANGSKSCRPAASAAVSPMTKEPMSNAVLAKNNVTLPRKLVRGQDVWLGRGAEQTRQILKCMWCAQSFKTLDEMTRHMRVTQHYTNIISQEQIISWRTPEDKLAQAQVNAVLTCKVCDEAFGSLKELSYHMVKNAHYKEHILRSITEGGHGRRRQTRERRKKSLPVRKLLELERMEIPLPAQSASGQPSASAATRDRSSARDHQRSESKSPKSPDGSEAVKSAGETEARHRGPSAPCNMTCEECGRRVEAKHLVGHLKQCKRRRSRSSQELMQAACTADALSPSSAGSSGPPSRSQTESPPPPSSSSCQPPAAKKSKTDDKTDRKEDQSVAAADQEGAVAKSTPPPLPPPQSSSACLSALQSLIDKSFDVKAAAAAASASAVPSKSSGSHSDSRKANGSRASSFRKLPLSASLSAVEKWMTLAKERDAPPTNMWSSSVSSSSSSWLGSDDEDGGGRTGVPLPANKPSPSQSKPVSSPVAATRPDSASSPNGPGDVITKQSRKKEGKEEDEKESSVRNEDAERREEIEELKRRANNNISEPDSPAKASSSASLSALERLIEKSFDSKKKNTPTGFLQRLGIDEEVCPPWQPGLGLGLTGMSFGHPFQPWIIPKHDARSDSSSPSKGTKNGSLSSSPPV